MGWLSPWVDAELLGGIALLVLFVLVEKRVEEPMFHIGLFRIRAFLGSNIALLCSSMGRGGLQFMLILWLQGIWLPLHGFSFASTPLWAGIYLVPMSVGFLATGPISGRLSDRYGQKWFATLGMAAAACTFVLLLVLPVNFPYPLFGLLILVNGLGVGMFSAPNTTTMMNSVPAADRGAASGMRATAMNAGFVLSIGIFFSLMIVGLSAHLPTALGHGLISRGVAASTADRVAALPAVATLFAAFLGVNPMKQLLGPHVLRQVGTAHAQVITGKSFFPSLISEPFHSGLTIAFAVSAVLCALAAFFSFWAGDSGAAASGRSVRPEPERFVDGHSTAPIGGIDAALPDVVEV